jgi:hypothetical protein
MRLAHIVGLALGLAATAFAAEPCSPCVAHLTNGFTVSHLRHEVVGDSTRLYVSDKGYVECPTAQISSYSQDDNPAPVPAAPAPSIDDHIARASQSSGVDGDFVRSVIQHESNFNPKAVSPKGARGLMQLMPGTAKQLGIDDSFDPSANIHGGSQYLRELLVRYNGDAAKALAAYNAGPAAVDRYHGVPPYSETRHYVARVITSYNKRKSATGTTVASSAKHRSATAHTRSQQTHTEPKSSTTTGQ